MLKIFVCHRREDTADVAGRIYDRLVLNYGVLKGLDSIPLGVDFRDYLGRMVGECDVFLAVIGPHWLDAGGHTSRLHNPRDFVRIEIESALVRGIPVVPLFVGGASMPAEEDLPESIRPFVYRNGVPVRPDPDFHHDMDRIIARLDGYGRPAPLRPTETAAPSWPEPIPGDQDRSRDPERERVPTDAEGTLADELAAAQERHNADLARLEGETGGTVDDATARDADARAEARAYARLTSELDRAGADAERMLADELAMAEERHRPDIARIEGEKMEPDPNGDPSDREDAWFLPDGPQLDFGEVPAAPGRMGSAKRHDAVASTIETPQPDAGMLDTPTLTTAEQAPTPHARWLGLQPARPD